MRANGCTLLSLLAIPILLSPAGNVPRNDEQLVRVIPELINTRYCYGDAQVYSAWLKLRVKYINRTNKPLILDKEMGKAWYYVKVARNLDDLAAGKYEYNPHTDWFFSDKDDLPNRPSADSPGSDFVILSPGGAFESEIDAAVVAQYENLKDFAGSIRPGVHFLQVDLSAWNHPGEARVFAESWRKFGQLVMGVIKTDPLEIQIPSDPKVEKKCK